ncbi:group 1 truncated hemoglobin [Altererythrobacter sp. ZODW24]|uniref:group I truncated hemoglobin n=1 Tax=Altererythrobacter sp. ZODW24 TaxID=2185142 RepID=UPI000DF74B17|nr:group 1 truncated hemoglobin [Altererythrobacter sp. ZODW24]
MTVSLYDRLGGYDAIVAFAGELIDRAQSDSLLGRFWSNRGEDRNARDLQLLIDYLVKETGGQMYYTGRSIALAHAGMGITETDWARFIAIVVNVAQEMRVEAPESSEVLVFLGNLKCHIVTSA